MIKWLTILWTLKTTKLMKKCLKSLEFKLKTDILDLMKKAHGPKLLVPFWEVENLKHLIDSERKSKTIETLKIKGKVYWLNQELHL